MEELIEYRQRMLKKMADAGGQLQAVVLTTGDPYKPLLPGSWNTHQVIAHMRDVNQEVYLPRLERIVAEDSPIFDDFDTEGWMTAHYQAREPIQQLVTGFAEKCRTSVEWLAGLPVEAWNRPGSHPLIGKHTLQWWVERTLTHITEHLAQLEPKGD
jgi:hypothetical protein